ncbi:MAG: T9SS type A sorting domain-containing protein [Ignavibacteriales bacterium]|nr:T9SS type A sorting domain-containing protein [Ignavibacteriales bacterium]
MKKLFAAAFILVLSGATFYYLTNREEPYEEKGHADDAFEWWYAQRALPGTLIPPEGLTRAVQYTERTMMRSLRKSSAEEPWESIGPDNIGGRVLSIAIDPDSTHILWAGSASGGLWRSTTGGVGAKAWELVNTGFYLLSVSTIVINESNPNEMYVGTGEISGYNLGQVGTPGARTTYGLGMLKSADRGATWQSVGLVWLFSQNRSIQKIVINPKNPQTIYIATSEGTYRSYNGGISVTKILDTLMAMDVALNPVDTSIVYVACGQRNTSPNSGMYQSTNGGNSFVKLSGGLPATNFGRTSLAISQSNPNVVYASIANAATHNLAGLYRTTNGGTTWELKSTTNYLSGQGWYNNICAVHPANSDLVYGAGLDAYKSTTGGSGLTQKSFWYKDFGGVVPAGGPEGPDDYAHADHHAIIFDPKNPNRMFFGNDGGIFESTDGGETFAGRNGGFVTTQFYNGFDNAATDSLIALGGLQDNGTVKWEGAPSWNKVYGGDGGWCAIDPLNKQIMYEEYVYLEISKTTDGGTSWNNIFNGSSDSANFIAPFVISPSNPNVLYAGMKKVIKTTDGGATWTRTNNNQGLNGSNVSSLAVSYTSPDTALGATGQRTNPIFEIFYTTNGGTNWTKSVSALPNRYPTDLAFDPNDSKIAYAVFSGYGTPHVYRSTDAGTTWNNISSNLPDIPSQAVCVDPLNPSDIYVGTDLGVYRTQNNGTSWEPWFDGMPYAMVLDVVYSPVDRRIRAATFGNGVYQRKLGPKRAMRVELVDAKVPSGFSLSQNYPNPFNPSTSIRFALQVSGFTTLKVFDEIGREVVTLVQEHKEPGTYRVVWDASGYASGTYYAVLKSEGQTITKKMLLMK